MSRREVVRVPAREVGFVEREVVSGQVDDLEPFFRDVPTSLTVVHEHRYPGGYPTEPVAPWVENPPRWGRVVVYVFGLVMLAVVVGLLVVAGVLDVSVPAPPWTR